MKILHLMAGLSEASGVANVARRFARVQIERGDEAVLLAPAFKWNPIYFGLLFAFKALWHVRSADQVWVHCSWTFPVWYGAFLAKVFGKKLIVVPEGSFDPMRLNNHARWKKRLVMPLDRWVLRWADEVLALCPAEIGWVEGFEPSAKVRFERVPVFYPEHPRFPAIGTRSAPLHVLFLGRAQDPLKGVRYLERAIAGMKDGVELRIESEVFGEEKEKAWAWCDVLCLPSLSENFGLVVAEALEHGKRVITTDGAPAWKDQPGVTWLEGFVAASDTRRIELLKNALNMHCRAIS